MSEKTQVLLVLGSAADEKYLGKCVEMLKKMQIPYVVRVASAHRSPDRVIQILKEFRDIQAIVAFAGHAAHLAGVIAAHSPLPVIAVPIPSSDLVGLDSLLAIVQMPGGVPVASMAIGEAGSQNAGCFVTQILALNDPALSERWRAFKADLARKVESSSSEIEKKWQ
jgi:phosphoribosylamine---glycine ligase